MGIADSFNKRTSMLLITLVVIGGGIIAYFLFFHGTAVTPPPEPEKIVKRMKIEVPAASEVKKEEAKPAAAQAQAPALAKPEISPVKPGVVKPEVKKKEDVKTMIEKKPQDKVSAPERETTVKKEEQKPSVSKKTTYKPWVVHIASYVSREEAEAMVKRFKQDNYNAYVTEFDFKGKQWYRLRIGFYSSASEARAVGQKISNGYNINGIWPVRPVKKEIMDHMN
ncbi:MAG: SPOR domain-containing protein [Deltaproteobacteria bacterium]|nr:SPOR domain-containing protein [Deltaproteobacteria bacterium]